MPPVFDKIVELFFTKINYRHTIAMLFFTTGIAGVASSWWEPFVEPLLEHWLGVELLVESQAINYPPWILIGLGFVMLLINHFVEKKTPHVAGESEHPTQDSPPQAPTSQVSVTANPSITLVQNFGTPGTTTGGQNPTSSETSTELQIPVPNATPEVIQTSTPAATPPATSEVDQTSTPTAPPAEFQKLRIGEAREMVGREDAMKWLKERIIDNPSKRVAVASVGAGGIGKTFLAHAFAEQYEGQIKILEMTVGERPALQAGIEFLEKNRVNVSGVRTMEELRGVLAAFYDQGQGILIVDDVWHKDVQDILPTTQNWKALLTTRDESLAKDITNAVLSLGFFTPEQSLELFNKVLEQNFQSEQEKSYQALAEWLGHRPYAIRLAAESLKNPLSAPDPQSLLQKLKTDGLQPPREGIGQDQRDLHQLRPLLEHCLSQLEAQSPDARQLLNALAVCADEGIGIQHFKNWQSQERKAEQVEHDLHLAQNYGLLFVESVQFSMLGDEHKVHRLRLHTDTLQVLRSSFLENEEADLEQFLHQTLVLSDEPFEPKRTLQFQVNALIQRHPKDFERLVQLYALFWIHLRRTGQLLWAHDLGQRLLAFPEVQKNKDSHQMLLGNHALILKNRGQLEEAMELHQKEEKLCEELGDKAGLQGSYGNQALILMDWGQLEEAMELHQKQEKLCEELGDKAGLSRSYGNQALILKAWGQLEEAMELHQKEEKLKEELGDKAGLSRSYGNQALILSDWGKLEEAMELHQKDKKLKEELGDKAGLIACYWNTGLLLKDMERRLEALEKLKASLALQEELKDPRLGELTKFFEEYKAEVDGEE